ncbi:MAG: universal stress protein [Chitinophagaceae bacterium]
MEYHEELNQFNEKNMKNFIVPIDFSENSLHAADYSVKLARQLGADIHLFHAYEEPIAVSSYDLDPIHYDTMREQILTRLEECKNTLLKENGPEINIICLVSNGQMIEYIIDLYEKKNAQLVVIGLTGSGGWGSFFAGNNALRIVEKVPFPILTVPPKARFRTVKKIVFACDLQEVRSTIPVEKIKKVLEVLNAELYILHIDQGQQEETILTHEIQDLNTLFQGMDFQFHKMDAQQVVPAIKDFSRDYDIDLVLMIPHPHGFFANLINAHHTRSLLLHSSIPILTIPQHSQAKN